ncbi:hypothetical protein ACYU03_03765 [Pseudomonas sp. X10]
MNIKQQTVFLALVSMLGMASMQAQAAGPVDSIIDKTNEIICRINPISCITLPGGHKS